MSGPHSQAELEQLYGVVLEEASRRDTTLRKTAYLQQLPLGATPGTQAWTRHLLNGGVTIRELGMSAARLRAAHKAQRDKIAASYGADQPEAMQLLADFHEMLEEQMSEVTP